MERARGSGISAWKDDAMTSIFELANKPPPQPGGTRSIFELAQENPAAASAAGSPRTGTRIMGDAFAASFDDSTIASKYKPNQCGVYVRDVLKDHFGWQGKSIYDVKNPQYAKPKSVEELTSGDVVHLKSAGGGTTRHWALVFQGPDGDLYLNELVTNNSKPSKPYSVNQKRRVSDVMDRIDGVWQPKVKAPKGLTLPSMTEMATQALTQAEAPIRAAGAEAKRAIQAPPPQKGAKPPVLPNIPAGPAYVPPEQRANLPAASPLGMQIPPELQRRAGEEINRVLQATGQVPTPMMRQDITQLIASALGQAIPAVTRPAGEWMQNVVESAGRGVGHDIVNAVRGVTGEPKIPPHARFTGEEQGIKPGLEATLQNVGETAVGALTAPVAMIGGALQGPEQVAKMGAAIVEDIGSRYWPILKPLLERKLPAEAIRDVWAKGQLPQFALDIAIMHSGAKQWANNRFKQKQLAELRKAEAEAAELKARQEAELSRGIEAQQGKPSATEPIEVETPPQRAVGEQPPPGNAPIGATQEQMVRGVPPRTIPQQAAPVTTGEVPTPAVGETYQALPPGVVKPEPTPPVVKKARAPKKPRTKVAQPTEPVVQPEAGVAVEAPQLVAPAKPPKKATQRTKQAVPAQPEAAAEAPKPKQPKGTTPKVAKPKQPEPVLPKPKTAVEQRLAELTAGLSKKDLLNPHNIAALSEASGIPVDVVMGTLGIESKGGVLSLRKVAESSQRLKGKMERMHTGMAADELGDAIRVSAYEALKAGESFSSWAKKAFKEFGKEGPNAKRLIMQQYGAFVRGVPSSGGGPEAPKTVVTARQARQMAADIATKRVRQYAAERFLDHQQVRKIAQEIKKTGKESLGEDISAYIEGIGNVKRSDTFADVQKRIKGHEAIVNQAKELLTKTREEVNNYVRDTIKDEADWIGFIENYIPHLYEGSKQAIQAFAKKWSAKTKHAEERKLPTLKDAVEAGLRPRATDITELIELYSEGVWKAGTNKVALESLKDIPPLDTGSRVITTVDKAPENYVALRSPMFKKMIGSEAAAVHPYVAPIVRRIITDPFGMSGVEALNSLMKAMSLSMSFFHFGALTESAQATLAKWYNPIRGMLVIGEKHPVTGRRVLAAMPHKLGVDIIEAPKGSPANQIIADAVREGGLQLGAVTDVSRTRVARMLQTAESRTKDIPGLGWVARNIRNMYTGFNKVLWDRYHAGLKAYTYYDIASKVLPKADPTQVAKIKNTIGSFVNDAFGGQEWGTKFWLRPEVQRALHGLMLAPDWTLSNLNIATKTFTRDPVRRRLQLGYWLRMLPTLYFTAEGIHHAIYKAFGDPDKGDKPHIWENEAGHKWDFDITPMIRKMPYHDPEDKTRYYSHFGKQAREVLTWAQTPTKVLRTKSSPLIQIAIEQISSSSGDGWSMDWVGTHGTENLLLRAKSVGAKFVPFSFRGTNFALTAPMSKGMTKWKGIYAVSNILEMYADPTLNRKLFANPPYTWAKIVKSDPEYVRKLEDLMPEVIDAMERNGVNPKKIISLALSATRSKYYQKFLAALGSGDENKMADAAEAILRLHGGMDSILRSMESKGIEVNDLRKQYIRTSFAEAARRLSAKSGQTVPRIAIKHRARRRAASRMR